jgi:KaiC/GvpD/RAD55 family RecA-like ATPase
VYRECREPRAGEITAYLSSHAKWVKSYAAKTGKELRFRPSPCCGHDNDSNPSAQVNEDTGFWRCFSCGTVGNWLTLTRAFNDPLKDPYKDDPLNVDFRTFEPLINQKRRPVSGGHYRELLNYCKSRGFTKETLDAWRVSTKGPNILRWPIYAWNKKWTIVNARFRVCLNREKFNIQDWFEVKGGPTGLLIGNHLLSKKSKRIIVTEGQWDGMAGYQIGLENVVSLPNGAENVRVREMLRYIPEDWEVWLALDMDDAGDRCAEKWFSQLGPDRVCRLNMPYKDLNEWLIQNPSLSSKDAEDCCIGLTTSIQNKWEKKESSRFENLSLEEKADEEIVTLFDTPWKTVNHLLGGGGKAAETTGFLAPSGVGKTTWANQLAIHVAKVHHPVGLISLEQARATVRRKLKDTIKGTCSKEEAEIVQNRLMLSSLEGSEVSWQKCVEEFYDMVERGAKLLIYDNLDHHENISHSDKAKAYKKMIKIAKDNNVHSLIVWQPKQVDRRQRINSGNQKGYSVTFQDADNYFNFNRIEDYNILEVEKCRDKGVKYLKQHVYFIYDEKSRCFIECVEKPSANEYVGNIVNFFNKK